MESVKETVTENVDRGLYSWNPSGGKWTVFDLNILFA